MTDEASHDSSEIALSFGKVLNSHGYNFQYRVLREAQAVAYRHTSPWGLLVHEFPVRVQGCDTRIDFVMKNFRRPLVMVAECKRANPSLADWCFAKVPKELTRSKRPGMFVETAAECAEMPPLRTQVWEIFSSDRVYHIALEVKSHAQGDPSGSGRGAVEEAAAQVCRGAGGLLAFFSDNLPAFREVRDRSDFLGVLPVIFTTARLWISDIDPSSAELASGMIDPAGVSVKEIGWLFYQYHQSPGLMHDVPPESPAESIADALYSQYVRPVAIVSAAGIAEFLSLERWSF